MIHNRSEGCNVQSSDQRRKLGGLYGNPLSSGPASCTLPQTSNRSRGRCVGSWRSGWYAFLFSCLGFRLSGVSAPHGWPGFRGVRGDGVSAETGVFPVSGEFGLEIVWKVPIGKGYSGVAVSKGTVATMFSDGATDWVIAFDDLTGAERWRFTIDETYRGHDGSDDGPISTPLIVGERVFCLGPKGVFHALDLATGRALWAKNLVVDLASKAPYYGFATSPLLHCGVLVLQTGSSDAGIAGFNPVTGERIWSAGGDGVTYQSPIALSWNGGGHVAAADNRRVYAIDAATGAVAWEFVHKGGGLRGTGSRVPVEAGEGRLFLSHHD